MNVRDVEVTVPAKGGIKFIPVHGTTKPKWRITAGKTRVTVIQAKEAQCRK